MSIFTNFAKVAHNLGSDILAFIEGPLWTFIQPTVKILESQGGSILVTAAENAVAVGFTTPGGGAAAMTAALASFSAEVAAKGLPFIESQARALIELALQNAKAAVPATPVAA